MHTLAIDKKQLRQSFNTAATTYDQAATLQREIGLNLLTTHQHLIDNAKCILDLGSGTGFISNHISKLDPNKKVIALDIAEKMLSKHTPQYAKICADAEQLCFQEKCFDLIVSNLTLQWCVNIEKTFQEIKSLLTLGGTFLFSTLGPHTLTELKRAWQQVDGNVHVNTFYDKTILQNIINQNGLQIQQLSHYSIKQLFPNLKSLMLNLKQLGAHNVNQHRSRGLLSKQKYQQLEAAYPSFNNHFPATFEVIIGEINLTKQNLTST